MAGPEGRTPSRTHEGYAGFPPLWAARKCGYRNALLTKRLGGRTWAVWPHAAKVHLVGGSGGSCEACVRVKSRSLPQNVRMHTFTPSIECFYRSCSHLFEAISNSTQRTAHSPPLQFSYLRRLSAVGSSAAFCFVRNTSERTKSLCGDAGELILPGCCHLASHRPPLFNRTK
jgi:hypothetical protein